MLLFIAAEYQLTIRAKSEELDALFHNVQIIVETKSIPLDHIVSHLICSFPELENELEGCKSMKHVFDVVRAYTSLDNVSYLETIVSNYELSKSNDLLQQYSESVEQLFEKTYISQSYEQTFMHYFTRYLLKEESITLVIELKEDETYTLLGIMQLLCAFFGKMASYIKLKELTGSNHSVRIVCYMPYHLINMFVKIVKDNTTKLLKANVLNVSIGGMNIFGRELEIEKEVSVNYIIVYLQ